MSTSTTKVLITGASRGIGKGLTSVFLQRPNHIVIASVRDLENETSTALYNLPRATTSKIVVVKLDSSSETDASLAVAELEEKHGITVLDIVIANAGVSNYFGPAASTPIDQMLDHFKINALGPLLLFQAALPALKRSKAGEFVVISSGAGSISGMEMLQDIQNTAYGASKATINFITRRIHFENPDIIAFAVNPGWLQTDLGNHAATGAGLHQAPMTVQDGVNGIIHHTDTATKEKTSGKFMSPDGQELDW